MRTIYSLILLTLCTLSCMALAEPPPRIYALAAVDHEFMQDQRRRVDELARRYLGRQLNRAHDNDVGILQALLDRRLVKPQQTLELQAMGVVLGDLLAQALGMRWVIYEDTRGRSRALEFAGQEQRLFPITMISRRAEAGAGVNVEAVYQKAFQLMAPYRKKLPFQ